MQPRPLVAVESAVKHTLLMKVQGIPSSEIEPVGALAGTGPE